MFFVVVVWFGFYVSVMYSGIPITPISAAYHREGGEMCSTIFIFAFYREGVELENLFFVFGSYASVLSDKRSDLVRCSDKLFSVLDLIIN